jgi:2-polyprenyl-6-methoxyphenol hydroxylase-like FAD-dependent oxidoreductase
MTQPCTTDVLIAGGGPCGLMLANELGRRHIRCLLVDPKPGTAFNPQANATQARTMEHFRRLGFAQEIRSLGLPPDHPTDIAYLTRFAGTELARLRLPTAAAAPQAIRSMSGSWSAAELPHRISQKFVEVQLRAFIMSVDGVSEFAFHIQMADDAATEALTEADARRLFSLAYGQDIEIEILSMTIWLAGHALVAESFQRGRVLLGGDAVHLFTPTGGLGYNTAVEDAVNLGWKLAHVIRGIAPATLLDSYEQERKPLALRNTGYARQFADSIGLFEAAADLEADSPEGAQARTVASEYLNGHVRREFNIPGVTFGGRYDGSPIIVADGTSPPPDAPNTYVPSACPGGRPPHAWLADGRSLYDTFHFEWTLLALGPDAPDTRAFGQAAQALGLDLRVVRQASAELSALYEAPLALMRPDQIVAWRGQDASQAPAVLARATAQHRGPGTARCSFSP